MSDDKDESHERGAGYASQHNAAGEKGGATADAFRGDQGVTGRRAMNDDGAAEIGATERSSTGLDRNKPEQTR